MSEGWVEGCRRSLRQLRKEIDNADLSPEKRRRAIEAYTRIVYLLLGE